MFDDEFIENLSVEPLEAAKSICEFFLEDHQHRMGGSTDFYDEYIEAYALMSSFLEANELAYSMPPISNHRANNIEAIYKAFSQINSDLDQRITSGTVEDLKSKFQARFKNTFAYEFSEGDIKRIQGLLNELRESISTFEGFEDTHRARLLRRLEKLQSELHKRVSDLDRFWGLIGDAGVVLGKFGDDAKPFVERVREIADIVWRTQSRAEELPSGTQPPLLKGKSEDNT